MYINRRQQKPEFMDLVLLMLTCHDAEVTQPVDRIYSVFGLSREGHESIIEPEYTSSLRSVFIDFAAKLLPSVNQVGRPHPFLSLTSGGLLDPPDPDLPTWTPQYRCDTLSDIPLLLLEPKPKEGKFRLRFKKTYSVSKLVQSFDLKVSSFGFH